MSEFWNDLVEKKKMEQRYKEAVLLSEIITGIRQNCDAFTKLSKTLEAFAIEAAELGRDEFVDELAETMASIEEFIEELKFLVMKIQVAYQTGMALSSLSGLPKAMKKCKGSIGRTLDFAKMGKDMASLMNSLGTARDQLTDFRRSLKKQYSNSKIIPEFAIEDEPKVVDEHHASLVSNIKKGIIASIQTKSSRPDPTPAPVVRDTSADDAATTATATEIASMMDDEQDE